MKKQQSLAGVLALALCTLAVSVGLSYAQGTGRQGGDGPASPLGSAFTYQGQLKSGDQPVDDTCDFEFGLYDAASLGSQIGISQTESLTVTGGLFTAVLDFGAGAFSGEARWLAVRVQCGAEMDYTGLGRQALTAAPYALYSVAAGDADTLDGQDASDFASDSHSHYALDAADGSPTEALYVDNDGEVGIGTTMPAGPLHISSASASNALVVLENGDIGIGTDAPYEAHVHIINPDTTSDSYSSLKIGGLNIPSSTPYNASLRLRTSAGGVATLYFHDRFQGTGFMFRKEADVGMGAWFRVINRHDSIADQTVYEFYNSGAGSSANDRMAVSVPLGIGTTDPQSALQVEGYIQLDTLAAAPPAADCDEASERGRMKVDIVNDLLYICTNSGWISK